MEKPGHIAIIMDGNGRWAQKNNLPRREGHKKGVEKLKEIVKATNRMDISCLTVYAFSTENWKRPGIEVKFLMKLFQNTLHNEAEELNKNGVEVKIIGRKNNLSKNLVKEINYIENLTQGNNKLRLNIAFNYGGRAEIVDAVKKIINNKIKVSELNQELFQKYLYIPEYSEVEFLIRTGGEKRISNFLLWEIAYAEIYISKKFWPEFTVEDYENAIKDFQKRDRRFGAIDEVGEK